METFDDLYEEQLNELMGSVRRAVSDKIGSIPDRMLAKIGSKTAEGRLTHRALVSKLHKDFRVYCGEQRIKQPIFDDVLDYLRSRVEMKFDDATMLRLGYGADAAKPATHEDEIQTVLDLLRTSFENGKPVDAKITQKIAGIVAMGGGDEVKMRSSLFKLAREYPNAVKNMKSIKPFIGGRQITTQGLNSILENVARTILKLVGARGNAAASKEGDGSDAPKRTSFGKGPGVNNNLDEDKSPDSVSQMVASKETGASLFFEELNSYGMSASLLKTFGTTYDDDPASLIDLVNSHYTDVMCAKLSRCLLQLFLHKKVYGQRHDILKPIYDQATQRNLAGYPELFDAVFDIMKRSGPYDRTVVNRKLYEKVKGEDMAAGFLAGIIICSYRAMRNIGQL